MVGGFGCAVASRRGWMMVETSVEQVSVVFDPEWGGYVATVAGLSFRGATREAALDAAWTALHGLCVSVSEMLHEEDGWTAP